MSGRESQEARDQRLRKLFRELDTKNQGVLDLEGLRRGLARIGHPLKDADDLLREILAAVDTSNDGLIQFSEFQVFFESAERELWRIFSAVDLDSNGKIDKRELRAALARAGLAVDPRSLDDFFDSMDKNNDGVISFEEWRDFLFFMPYGDASLRSIYSYYLSTVKVNSEGDANLDELNLQGFGYFLAGGLAGALSRTATAPFDRLKVYLIAQTRNAPTQVVEAATKGEVAMAAKAAAGPFKQAVEALWKAGGVRSFFAGNGLNIVKVLPESAIKFGSYEAAKRFLATVEGAPDASQISQPSRFLAGGIGGVVSQLSIYPIDTVKFRLQCSMVSGGPRGNALIVSTVRNTYLSGPGLSAFYRGLPLSLIGIFPYSAIDLGTFELMKRTYIKRRAKALRCDEKDLMLPNWLTLMIGATSGSVGASIVYPINVLRTRLQAQGTAQHPQTYTGFADVVGKTYRAEGAKGFFRGLTPNLMKVIPAVSISYLVYENTKQALGLQ